MFLAGRRSFGLSMREREPTARYNCRLFWSFMVLFNRDGYITVIFKRVSKGREKVYFMVIPSAY